MPLTAFGETKSVAEWTRDSRCSVCVSVLHWRLKQCWPAELAITAPRKRYWTAEEDRIVREYATGKNGSWGECAAVLHRSVVAIRSRAARLGCERPLPNVSDDQIRELHAQGLSTFDIGSRLGVSDECVRRRERLMGLSINKRDEQRRMATLLRNIESKHGVGTIAKVKKLNKRKARRAALEVQLTSFGEALEAVCPH